MIKFITVTLSALFLLATNSFAADNIHVVNKSKKKYEQNNAASDPCESTGGLGQQECAQKKIEIADKKLNVIYKSLLAKLPEIEGVEGGEAGKYPKKGLIDAQIAWIKFRDKNCEFVGDVSGGAPLWRRAYDGFCRAEMTETRAKELQKYFDDYN